MAVYICDVGVLTSVMLKTPYASSLACMMTETMFGTVTVWADPITVRENTYVSSISGSSSSFTVNVTDATVFPPGANDAT